MVHNLRCSFGEPLPHPLSSRFSRVPLYVRLPCPPSQSNLILVTPFRRGAGRARRSRLISPSRPGKRPPAPSGRSAPVRPLEWSSPARSPQEAAPGSLLVGVRDLYTWRPRAAVSPGLGAVRLPRGFTHQGPMLPEQTAAPAWRSCWKPWRGGGPPPRARGKICVRQRGGTWCVHLFCSPLLRTSHRWTPRPGGAVDGGSSPAGAREYVHAGGRDLVG